MRRLIRQQQITVYYRHNSISKSNLTKVSYLYKFVVSAHCRWLRLVFWGRNCYIRQKMIPHIHVHKNLWLIWSEDSMHLICFFSIAKDIPPRASFSFGTQLQICLSSPFSSVSLPFKATFHVSSIPNHNVCFITNFRLQLRQTLSEALINDPSPQPQTRKTS